MIPNYKLRQLQIFIQDQLPSLGSLVVVIIIFLLLVNGTKKYYETTENLNKLKEETTNAKMRMASLEKSKSLAASNLEEINKLVSVLLPDQEDYFSIIFALEKVSKATGFKIDDYNIRLANSTPERLSLVVSGKGDAQAFLRFLDSYSFAGGRFATSEKIEYAGSAAGGTRIALNFYSRKMSKVINEAPIFTPKDASFVQMIKDKLLIDLKTVEAETPEKEDLSYPVKSNPF